MAEGLPILCLDFDGVVHDYKRGWQKGEIYGHLTYGFLDWAREAQKSFTLVIYSSRSKDADGVASMAAWLEAEIGAPVVRKAIEMGRTVVQIGGIEFQFAYEKPPAFIIIDDRAMQFRGDWSEFYPPSKLRQFKPWTDAK